MSNKASGTGARGAAAEAVAAVLGAHAHLDAALEAAHGFSTLAPRDRAFARAIAATALRRLGQIDAALAPYLKRTPPEAARAILRCGAGELIFLGVAPHAAVASNVALAGADRRTRSFKGLINAVLRRVSENADAALTLPPEANLPGWLRESWTRAYGAETARAMAGAHMADPPLDLTAKADPQAVADMTGGAVLPTGTVRLTGGGRVEDIAGFADGAWWVQDAAAALPARLLAPAPGETVYDLCAAPGGKTMQLAAMGAKVTAVDASPGRLKRVSENLERTGLSAAVEAADVSAWAPADGPADAVLLDAPCSATGTLRRSPDAAWIRGPKDVARLAGLQQKLLDLAGALTRPGGRMVYCVCSLQPEEGEAQIAAFLTRNPEFRIAPVGPEEVPGLAEAVTKEGTLRVLPAFWGDRGGIDGFFAARLERAPFTGRSTGPA